MGGPHPSMCAGKAAAHADAIMVGDVERVWGTILADAAADRLKPRSTGGIGLADGPDGALGLPRAHHGVEGITRASMREACKAPNLGKVDGYATQIKVLRGHGFQIRSAFTLGHDHDTADCLRATLDFALENRFTFAAFNILMPYPSRPST